METTGNAPVRAQAAEIVSLQLGEVEGRVRRILLCGRRVFVEIDWLLGQTVAAKKGLEVRNASVWLALPSANLVPRVDIWEALIAGDNTRPGVPVRTVDIWGMGKGGTSDDTRWKVFPLQGNICQ